jgi:hypothetical protein
MENWILSRVRRSSAKVLGVWGLVFLAIGLAVVLSWRYWDNFLHGPFKLGPAELGSIGDVSKAPRYYVRLKGTKLQDARLVRFNIVSEHGKETRHSITAHIYALTVGEKLLIIESPAMLSPAQVVQEGALEGMPADLDKALFDFPDNQDIRARFYPFILKSEGFQEAGYASIVAFLVFFGFFLRYAIPVVRRLVNPMSHPAAKRVAAWRGVNIVAPDVERELRSPKIITRSGWTVTDSFIIRRSFLAFDLFRFSDLLWAYGGVSVQRFFFVPVWTSCCANLIGLGGAAFIKTDLSMVNAILAFASQRAPWAYFGFSSEVQSRVLKDKEGFCREVAERKRGMRSC